MMPNENVNKSIANNPKFKPMFVYLSQLMDKPVIDNLGIQAGELYDIVVKKSAIYPQSDSLIIRRGYPNRKYALVKWSDISEIDEREVRLKIDGKSLNFYEKHDEKAEFTLRRDILDQQVVDTYNHKVIRVNDIHLLLVDDSLMLAHVDISTRGLLRRLGLEKSVDFLVRFVNKNARYLKAEYLISWKFIQPLSINPVSMTIKIDAPQSQLSNIPAADLGEIFLDLSTKHQVALFKSLDINTKARTFVNIDFKTQNSLVEELSDKDVVELLNSIPSDETIDFLEKLPKDETEKILKLMESKTSKKLSELLGYSSDSAAGLMITEFMAFLKGTSINAVLSQLKIRSFKTEPAQFVYIVDENYRLVGSTNFRRMIFANPDELIEKVMFPKTYYVRLNSSVKEVAYLMEKYKYYAIPVVDDNNVLQGIVTVDDVLSQIISIAWRRLKKIKVLPKQQAQSQEEIKI
ncbi:MAG: CBS domain-containing protein [Candidatus Omnitrophota bacterium]|nr:CBS domain-containing protein [Candidatus Omnitrophota bacterium]